MRADLVDRALDVLAHQRAVGADLGLVPPAERPELLARPQHPALHEDAEGDAGLGLLGRRRLERGVVEAADLGDARLGGLAVGLLALDADEVAAQRLATAPVVPVPKKGSSTTSPGLVVARMMRWRSDSGFCVGWALAPSSPLSRSWPVQMGSTQSDRICTPSLSAFSAS
jgi:hypothetical protein